MDFAQIILSPFVWLLTVFYNLFGSYGLALIFFAIVVKLILFPFSLKGKRSMIQMNMLSDKMQKLQKQYGKDKERYNLEVQKLYEKEKVNPMSGCLWSFVPLLILLPLYAIIRQPLKYMMGVNSQDLLNAVANAVQWNSAALDMGWIKEAADSFANTGYNQLYLASLITPENLASVQAAVGEAGSKIFSINFDFLGLIDLSQTPQLKFWTISGGFGLFLLPVISAASGFVFSLISMKTNSVNQKSAQAANNATAKSMLIVSPLMSLWIGFAMPAALCVYWIANNLLSMLQEFLCGKLLKKDYEKAAAQQAERERQEKEEEKERRRLAAEERARRLEEEKQNKGRKKKAEKKPAEEEEKIPGAVKEASRVGMRQYARGRAYDPYRYSAEGPTAYPGAAPVFQKKEDTRALEKESDELEQVALEQAADEAIVEAIREEQAGAAPEGLSETPVLETPTYEAPDYDAAEAEAPYAEESEESEDKDKE
ncbi:YidC/Oxa1 family membrane protein insertase [Flavonifractor sp. DFI.6.63]|uniref:YidC/Oxa1 family membrane protein insertase n=1 Tax=Flavonifractor sp. DFI.6.63 TaxID=2963704 RepID=UPI0021098DB1|nr:YidC/Oxa1 family membrane protein insertase [Flavonifractor sp. DFI.6.63]MCQ5029586.1 YidC/Oxa1 family membrane protein insertase [Flavonifractor sp. DFI.6.63]MDU2194181.1 YidC/Oxa1 family membrane protein insertase [Clostridiales bacterium]